MKTVEEIAYWVDTKRAPCLLRLQPPASPASPAPPAKRKLPEPDPPPSAEPCPEPRAPARPARARPRAVAAAPSSENGLFSGATRHKRSPDERAAGDTSDVSGLTASYIRSTKRAARAPAAPARDKFLVCLNKSVNTIGDPDHNLNFSNDSNILNIVSVQTGDGGDSKTERSTSLLKFMEPRTATTCGYFTRSKANSLENMAPTSCRRARRNERGAVDPVLVLDAARHSSSGTVNVARPARRPRPSPAPIPDRSNFNKCFSDSDECSPRKQKFFA